MKVNILSEEEFQCSTITLAASFNISLDIKNLASWMPVKIIYNDQGERQFLVSGSRESIKYFGPEGSIVSMCYKKIRRGMRTGAMNNMISADIQYGQKNIHLKISSTSITSVGTSTFEQGEEVLKITTQHIRKLKEKLDFINNIDKSEKEVALKWLKETVEKEKVNTIQLINLISKSKFNQEFLNFCALFVEDDSDVNNYIEKMDLLLDPIKICNDGLECSNLTVYNSVYHINSVKNANFKMPLHRLAPFLASKNVAVEYHNWTSEGVNICFDIEEKKEGINHANKEYRHRFSIHDTTKIRQCSPTRKAEAYANYLGVMNLLQEFFEHPEVNFDRYVCENFNEKKALSDYLLVKN